jgi:hypothetical protein
MWALWKAPVPAVPAALIVILLVPVCRWPMLGQVEHMLQPWRVRLAIGDTSPITCIARVVSGACVLQLYTGVLMA